MEDIIRIYIYIYIYFGDNKKIQSSFSVLHILFSFSVLQVYYFINNINRY